MSDEPVLSHDGIDAQDFWKAAKIWLRNPHVVNRRILTTSSLLLVRSNTTLESISTLEWMERLASVAQLHESGSIPQETDILQALKLDPPCQTPESLELEDPHDITSYVYLQKLLPRNPEIFSQSLELAIIDKANGRIAFVSNFIDKSKQPLCLKWPYILEHNLESQRISLRVQVEENLGQDPSVKWLKEQFFPRFVKWTDMENPSDALTSGSLNLVSVEKYAALYNDLKKKYGTEMVKIWPENTDPAKFVYEDVAIATYLLLLWEMERETKNVPDKQSFVDLGCGNGLLVHILASEGHPGLGIDLRKRNIWDLYPKTTRLEVRYNFSDNL